MADGTVNDNNIFEIPAAQDDDELNDEEEGEHNNIDNNAIDENYENSPLYFGAEITVRESNLAILSLYLKHNLYLADIIKLVMLHCLRRNLKKIVCTNSKSFSI